MYLLRSDNIKAESNITIIQGKFQVRNPREFKLLATYLQPPRKELELRLLCHKELFLEQLLSAKPFAGQVGKTEMKGRRALHPEEV